MREAAEMPFWDLHIYQRICLAALFIINIHYMADTDHSILEYLGRVTLPGGEYGSKGEAFSSLSKSWPYR